METKIQDICSPRLSPTNTLNMSLSKLTLISFLTKNFKLEVISCFLKKKLARHCIIHGGVYFRV